MSRENSKKGCQRSQPASCCQEENREVQEKAEPRITSEAAASAQQVEALGNSKAETSSKTEAETAQVVEKKAAEPSKQSELEKELELAREEIARLSEERDSWKSKAENLWDQYLRVRAEMDNFRKRTERDIQDRINRGKAEFFARVLEVVDNFDRFIQATEKSMAENETFKGFFQGVTMIHKQLLDILAKEGVVPMECPVGKMLDPYYHEAVMVQEGGGEHGTIVEEIQKGYLYQGQVLRPSRVKVIK